jgi:uncharacterized membrane protein YdjX (TVP38/TMEM64 family)
MHAPTLRRALPLLALLAAFGLAFGLGLHRHLSLDALAAHRTTLEHFVAANPVAAPLAYMAAYAVAVALSLPGALILTLAGGLLFGALWGTVFAVAGATVGAVGLFLAARGALAPALSARAGPFLDRLRPGLERDGLSYLLVLRLVPLFPFWLVNLAPALVGMKLAPFALGTFLGIIPGTAVFAGVGAGLAEVFAAGRTPDLGIVLRPGVLLPLLGLALLSLVPVLWRRFSPRKDAHRKDTGP